MPPFTLAMTWKCPLRTPLSGKTALKLSKIYFNLSVLFHLALVRLVIAFFMEGECLSIIIPEKMSEMRRKIPERQKDFLQSLPVSWPEQLWLEGEFITLLPIVSS